MLITFFLRERYLNIFKQAFFFLMSKNGKIFFFFHNYSSRFHKIKSRTYIKNLRHDYLPMNVLCRYVKFHAWGMINKGDILIQRIKVKKSIFRFPDPSFHCLPMLT